MQTQRLLVTIERHLQQQAHIQGLTSAQVARARALAVAAVLSMLIGITPAQLFALLEPAFVRFLIERDHTDVAD